MLMSNGREVSTTIPWDTFKYQFGQGFKTVRQFRYKVTRQLQHLHTHIYPGLKISVGDRGVTLKLSPMAVQDKKQWGGYREMQGSLFDSKVEPELEQTSSFTNPFSGCEEQRKPVATIHLRKRPNL
jgi:hypothetical protein